MRYLPLTAVEREKILKLCGAASFEELTSQVPEPLRVKGLLDLERALSEPELVKHLSDLASHNKASGMISFLGQGAFDHTWPSVIDQIQNRGEFLTAYTPYQPEISQGTLQVIFEYQSMIANLMGMDVSNASLYDGATSVVEGVLMAARLQGLKSGRVVVSEGTYGRYRHVLESYLVPLGFEIETWRANTKTFRCEASQLSDGAPVVAVVLQSPNTWGLIEDWQELAKAAAQLKTKSVAVVTHALAPALFEAPGHAGIDIVTGEGQALGIPVGFGGPYLGLFCCKKSDVRQMPGRLVGATVDSRGERAFCVTLATREQHIRREKATSNICSNQNLMALRACLYLTLMGPEGMRKVAKVSRSKAYYLRNQLTAAFAKKLPELSVCEGEILNEVCIRVPQKQALWVDEARTAAESQGLLAGAQVNVPGNCGFVNSLVLACTEAHSVADLDRLVKVLAGTGA